MTSEQGTRTPAQRKWEENRGRFNSMWPCDPVDRTIWERSEEIASDVRALAATVDALAERVEMHDSFGDLEYRIYAAEKALKALQPALESPGSAEAAPEPVCQCGHPKSKHCDATGRCGYVHSEFWQTGGSVCGCGCVRFAEKEDAAHPCDLCDGDGWYWNKLHEKKLKCGYCSGTGRINRTEQAVNQEPPALDPVLVAAIGKWGGLMNKVGYLSGQDKPTAYDSMRCNEAYDVMVAAIRAYVGDAREGGK